MHITYTISENDKITTEIQILVRRRSRLKICSPTGGAGSSPAVRTNPKRIPERPHLARHQAVDQRAAPRTEVAHGGAFLPEVPGNGRTCHQPWRCGSQLSRGFTRVRRQRGCRQPSSGAALCGANSTSMVAFAGGFLVVLPVAPAAPRRRGRPICSPPGEKSSAPRALRRHAGSMDGRPAAAAATGGDQVTAATLRPPIVGCRRRLALLMLS